MYFSQCTPFFTCLLYKIGVYGLVSCLGMFTTCYGDIRLVFILLTKKHWARCEETKYKAAFSF